jgi:hypothetical protein
MRVARPYKKKDPVQTLAMLVPHAVSALGLQCSAAKQMGQTQFRTDLMSAFGTKRTFQTSDQCPLLGAKQTSQLDVELKLFGLMQSRHW